MHHPPMLLAIAWGLTASVRVSLFCRCSNGLQFVHMLTNRPERDGMWCYNITLLHGESPSGLILSHCQQFSFLLYQILTFPATFWPHLFRFLRIPTERGRCRVDCGIIATVGPLGIIRGWFGRLW